MLKRIQCWFQNRRLNTILLDADLQEFKAKATAEEIMVDSERRKEDAIKRAQRTKEDAARWAKFERERVEIIRRHQETTADRAMA